MLKVLLVDDEPFILKGLSVIIDWNKTGYEIIGTATNGLEAIEFLKVHEVDVIIADINMPAMNGLELLKKIREEKISNAYYIILSGYATFSYAQKAMNYECVNYMLKPVDQQELLNVLGKVKTLSASKQEKTERDKKMERAYLDRNLIAVISGKYDAVNLEYIKKHLRFEESGRYVEIEIDWTEEDEISDAEKRGYQRKLFDVCIEYLKDNSNHCVFDASGQEKVYDVGFIFCDYMAKELGMTNKEYLEKLLEYINTNVKMKVIMLVGKTVNSISNITRSYSSVCMMHSLQGFHTKNDINYYEEEIQFNNTGIVLCKKNIDQLIKAIELNDHNEITKSANQFFDEMKQMDLTGKAVNLNINYLLFQLIHLATEQDDCINQEEVLRLISESTFEEGIMRGSKSHICRFACEYGDYLSQLRQNVSHGVLAEVEKEIQKRYASNLTLKELSEKYYVNSAYLGQLFRKNYGQSFKDYLNEYRMGQAAIQLLHTDKKIYEIAESVGYHDVDYFVNRFILVKGCTPASFRKQYRINTKKV
ncbi:MAG: response regulator [Clostridiales bacterium]|nr:response regulator [Clostridiales bacterium]